MIICVSAVYQGYFLGCHLQASGVDRRGKERLAALPVLLLVDQKAGLPGWCITGYMGYLADA